VADSSFNGRFKITDTSKAKRGKEKDALEETNSIKTQKTNMN
jgi:hypothetical protein